MSSLEELFKKHFGTEPESKERMPLSGSNREYYLLKGNGNVCVGTIGKELKENQAFISFTNAFSSKNLPVPKVLVVADDGYSYLQTYIEGVSLFDFLEKHRLDNGNPDNQTIELYKKVLAWLPKFQILGGQAIDFSQCYPREKFDVQSIMWDLNYFKYYFLKSTHTVFDEQLLENDFNTLTNYLCSVDSKFFLYRDFQSRNILITPSGEPYFIDYQGGRQGASQYDIASLLYDGKAALSPEVKSELLDFFIDQFKNSLSELLGKNDFDEKEYRDMFAGFAYVRVMQACGSYGYRGFLEQKSHFLNSIPPAMRNIKYLLENHKLPIEIPQLEACLKSISENEELLNYGVKKTPLTVTVMSFSYKKGIPYDPTGNGGGFVFDCRAIHNPGRYDEYKTKTGKDQEVIDFFANEPEMAEFVELSQKMVKMSIEKYLKRGFKNLSVLFGCTGGQHRSVYSAEKMADFIRANYPEVIVDLSHREQERKK